MILTSWKEVQISYYRTWETELENIKKEDPSNDEAIAEATSHLKRAEGRVKNAEVVYKQAQQAKSSDEADAALLLLHKR